MTRRVRLDRLPTSVRFPEELVSRIAYDSVNRQLQFEGFMSKVDFDKLVRLSNDLAYQRALEELFQICTFSSSRPTTSGRRWPWLAFGLGFGVLALIAAVWALRHG